ncbi:MAG: response regulator [Anaerolineae bacterium]
MKLQGKKIFIIEDEPNSLAIVSSILRRQGAAVHFDPWGIDTAERILKAMPVDMILLDLMLPDQVSGYDVFRALRAIPALQSIPIVAVTAMDPATELAKTRAMGFAGFICKPIRTRTFVTYLEAILDGIPVWIDLA